MTTVDVPDPEFLISQSTFILALIISLGSAAAIAIQAVRGVNKRIRRGKEEADAKIDAKIEELRKEIVNLKERSEYINHKIIDGFFDQKRESTE